MSYVTVICMLSELYDLAAPTRYLKAIDLHDVRIALPLLRRLLRGVDRRRRRHRFVDGEVDDLRVHVKQVQLVEAELQRRVPWAELSIHATQPKAEGAVVERELGVAVQMIEGELGFNAVVANLDRLVHMLDVLEGSEGYLEGSMFCKVRF